MTLNMNNIIPGPMVHVHGDGVVARRLIRVLLQMKSMIAVMMFAGVALAAPGGYTGQTKHFSKIIFPQYNWTMQAMGGFTRT